MDQPTTQNNPPVRMTTITNMETLAMRGEAEKHRDSKPSTSEGQLLKELQFTIGQQASQSTFACGGSISTATSKPTIAGHPSTKPVSVRFEDEHLQGHALRLPTSTETDLKAMTTLLEACQPATFGRGDQDVLDATYRKAGKLNCDAFDTSFSPYEEGIIDSIAQLLSPSLCRQDELQRSIRAELYALNIYSGPDGKFKAHVDTPRGAEQFGGLVVCLPVEHEGGQLAVRYGQKNVTFDWSTQGRKCKARARDGDETGPQIQWAAFYSDCEHEVMPVMSGHRITLTYNLYARLGIGTLAGQCAGLDATKLPIFKTLKRAVEEPQFMPGGRKLAVYLAHAYAHTNSAVNLLPHSFKGVDMVIYESARALGLNCAVRPVMEVPKRPCSTRPSDCEDCDGCLDCMSDEEETIMAAGLSGKVEIGGYQCEGGEEAEWFENNWPYEELGKRDVV